MVKMFYVRRGLDSTQRKQIVDSSKEVANLMVKHLRFKHDGEHPCPLNLQATNLDPV